MMEVKVVVRIPSDAVVKAVVVVLGALVVGVVAGATVVGSGRGHPPGRGRRKERRRAVSKTVGMFENSAQDPQINWPKLVCP